jgi:hypothetical protein
LSFKIEEATQSLLSEDKEARESIRTELGTQIDFLTHVLGTIRVTLDEYGLSIPTDTACSAVGVFLFCKIVRTGRAVRELTLAGYGVEADLLLRTTLEALINLRFIVSQNCEERAQLYIEFEHVLAHQYLQRVDRWQDLFAGLDLVPRRFEIEKQYQRVKANYPDQNFWAAKLIRKGRLRSMAEDVGLKWYYDFIYWFGSNQSHSNARSANEYMDISPGGTIIYKLGPSGQYRQLVPPLSLTADLLIRALKCIVSLFSIPAEETVKQLEEGYATTFGDDESRSDQKG